MSSPLHRQMKLKGQFQIRSKNRLIKYEHDERFYISRIYPESRTPGYSCFGKPLLIRYTISTQKESEAMSFGLFFLRLISANLLNLISAASPCNTWLSIDKMKNNMKNHSSYKIPCICF